MFWPCFFFTVALFLIGTVVGASEHASRLSGKVVDKATDAPVPGVTIKVRYYGDTIGVTDRASVTFDTVCVTTDETGSFRVPGKNILTIPYLIKFSGIHVEVEHPSYLVWFHSNKFSLSRANITPERCKNLKIELVRLEDMHARGKRFIFLVFRGELWMKQPMSPLLGQ